MADTSFSYVVIWLITISIIGRQETTGHGRFSRCGERPAANDSINQSLLSRIVGGTSARKEECPWIVSFKKDGKHFCGGTIISDKHVLTAAHCLIDKNIEFYIKVVVGDYDFNSKEPTEQSFEIRAVHRHPDFNSKQPYNYDIAVVEVLGRITFDGSIQPACLPSPDDKFPKGYMCDTMGYGRLEENGKLPTKLQKVSLPVIEHKSCMVSMKTVDQRLQFNTVVCAGYPEGGKDACQGDSGGPFLCQRSHGTWVLVGVTSWGLGCARKWADNFLRPPDRRGSPGIFTDIQMLRDWIITKLNQENSDSTAAQVRCGTNDGFLRGPAGEITHPKGTKRYYSNNENCVWRILLPEGNHILLMFNHFSVEWDHLCDLDYLGIYSSSGRLIGKFCGDVRPRPLRIQDRSITVKFISDFQEYRSGFSLSYEAVEPNLYPDSECGSVAVILEEGEIQTMNHPEPYSSNAVCQWVVHCPPSHLIKLSFVIFELEPHEDCIFDYTVVHYDLQGTMEAGKFCGFSLPDPIVSISNVMQITFTSDYAANYVGFRALITFVPPSSRNKNSGIQDKNQQRKNQDAMENGGNVDPGIQWNSQSQRNQEAMKDVDEVCGAPLKPPRFNSHSITTAEEAMPNSVPWHVSVNLGNTHMCNGAIVSKTFILTSATCVTEWKSLGDVGMIVAGLHDLKVSLHTQKRRVKQVVLHPKNDPLTKNYCVALIQVDEPFQFGSYVQPVCLPDAQSALEPSDLCVVTGWNLNEELATKLQQLEVPILLDDICSEYYPGRTDSMFCCGPVEEKDNAAYLAQSGAPLVYQSNTGNFIIYGVDIGSAILNKDPKPGVYSRVSLFSQWIRDMFRSADDTGFEPQDPLIPLDSQKISLPSDRPPADNPGSTQNIDVTCTDIVSLQSPGKIRMVTGGQKSPDGDRCRVVFQARCKMVLNFLHLKASSDHCSLMIYDGESSNKTFKARLTKEKIPMIIKASGPAITIEVGGPAQDSELQLWLSYTLHDQN